MRDVWGILALLCGLLLLTIWHYAILDVPAAVFFYFAMWCAGR